MYTFNYKISFFLSTSGKHVIRFASDTVLEPDRVHVEQTDGSGPPAAHIGLLRNHHTYRAEIPVAHSLGTKVTAEHPQHNIYVRVVDISQTEEILDDSSAEDKFFSVVTVQIKTIKEGPIQESIELVSEEDVSKRKEIVVTAKALLSNQGNPLLKSGVHMLSHEHQDESDFTEWPGHGRNADS